MDSAQLIVDRPAPGDWNMAVDAALLAACPKQPVLRFYRWQRPTLSLGYFQLAAQRAAHPPSLPCDCVRRTTGGGAIIHHHELTYSLVVPPHHPLARDHRRIYAAVHQALIETLADLGIADATRVVDPPPREPNGEPFLCFQRRAPEDVLLRGWKICGSAQRRRQDAILQHGSILMAQSPHAPELPGLAELAGSPPSDPPIIDGLQTRLGALLRANFRTKALGQAVATAAEEIRQKQFSRSEWTFRR